MLFRNSLLSSDTCVVRQSVYWSRAELRLLYSLMPDIETTVPANN